MPRLTKTKKVKVDLERTFQLTKIKLTKIKVKTRFYIYLYSSNCQQWFHQDALYCKGKPPAMIHCGAKGKEEIK